MDDIADDVANDVDAMFAAREAELLNNTTLNWDKIKPDLADDAEYDRLMAEVQKATDQNEDLGQLITRLEALGDAGIALAGKVKKFAIA